MYSPYLYARRSELLALRALISEEIDFTGLIPIIEPVLVNTGDIHRCMEAFGKNAKNLVILTNPNQHQFSKDPSTKKTFRDNSHHLFVKHETLIPGYCIGATTTQANINSFLSHYKDKNVALLYNSPALNEQEIKSNSASNQVSFHIVLNDKISTNQSALLPTHKKIDIRDSFNKLDRNADYSGRELFTDKHKNVGIGILATGDYTITGRKLEMGGGKPGAVASHITFKHQNTLGKL